MTEENVIPVMPPIKLAFVLDGEVVDVLHTDERLAAIFLSNPTVVNVTGVNGSQTAFVGDLYNQDNGTFIAKAVEEDNEPPADPNSKPGVTTEPIV
jgi:hypothetical protein